MHSPLSPISPSEYVVVTRSSPPTPTPVVPRPRDCKIAHEYRELPIPETITVINPEAPSQQWHDQAIAWRMRQIFWFHEFENDSEWAELRIINDGRWTLNIFDQGDAVHTLGHGTVEVNEDWEDDNAFKVDIVDEHPVSVAFYVNDDRIAVVLDQADRDAIKHYFSRYVKGLDDYTGYLRGRSFFYFDGNATVLEVPCREE